MSRNVLEYRDGRRTTKRRYCFRRGTFVYPSRSAGGTADFGVWRGDNEEEIKTAMNPLRPTCMHSKLIDVNVSNERRLENNNALQLSRSDSKLQHAHVLTMKTLETKAFREQSDKLLNCRKIVKGFCGGS